jgi:ribosome biogenesis GTPase / thiamine phosphate phosphatase
MSDTAESNKSEDERPRRISKPRDIEKRWRKGETLWRFDEGGGGDSDFLDRKRSAPPKHQAVKPGNERDALVVQTGGPVVLLQDGDEEFRAYRRRSTTTENEASTLIAVGDRVRYLDAGSGDAVVTHIYARKSALSRKAVSGKGFEQVLVANIDQIVIVSAATLEQLRPGLIDRYLIATAMGGLEAIVCINKMDLVDEEDLTTVDDIAEMYRAAGYFVLYTSCVTGEGIGELHNLLRDKLSAFSGHSGVGKTSLLNRLLPEAFEKTMEISEQSRRGIHTTSKSKLFDLPSGGYVADTPGIREFGLYHFDKNDLHTYYPEFVRATALCRFQFCTHTHEPGCAVIQAVQDEEIHPIRYRNYLQIMESEE